MGGVVHHFRGSIFDYCLWFLGKLIRSFSQFRKASVFIVCRYKEANNHIYTIVMLMVSIVTLRITKERCLASAPRTCLIINKNNTYYIQFLSPHGVKGSLEFAAKIFVRHHLRTTPFFGTCFETQIQWHKEAIIFFLETFTKTTPSLLRSSRFVSVALISLRASRSNTGDDAFAEV
ncbi:hypothetical protein VTN77DRAFT_647 [Rasamsonia byssochlamydoides]|uniref:uncharacterized protein n=1 Tax=Rasamsonia byssochlamydoides TaxID=89139 RepID=UPI0037431163